MKTRFLLLFLFFSYSSFAQNVQWAQRLLSEGIAGPGAVVADPNGNTIVAGYFTDDMSLDGTTMPHEDGDEIFLAKLDVEGDLIWIETFVGLELDRALDVITDGAGNIYLGGVFSDEMDFQGTTLISQGSVDVFIARFNPSGSLDWVQSFGSNQPDWCHKLELTADALLACGRFRGTASIDGNTYTSEGIDDAWITSLDLETGTFNWTNTFGAGGLDRFNSLKAANDGSIIAAGLFSGTIEIGPDILTAQAGTDPLVVKLSSSGNPIWAKGVRTPEEIGAFQDVTTNTEGTIFLSGIFSDILEYDENFLFGYGSGSYDPFIMALDEDGVWLWGKSTSLEGNSYPGQLQLLDDHLHLLCTVDEGINFDGSSIDDLQETAGALCSFQLDGTLNSTILFDGVFANSAAVMGRIDDDLLLNVSYEQFLELEGQTYNGLNGSDVLLFRYSPEIILAAQEVQPTGFEDWANAYWNPDSGVIGVRILSEIPEEVRLFSLDGRLLYQVPASSYLEIPVTDISSGLLVLQVQGAGQSIGELIPIFR